jgi:hypothetical protein
VDTPYALRPKRACQGRAGLPRQSGPATPYALSGPAKAERACHALSGPAKAEAEAEKIFIFAYVVLSIFSGFYVAFFKVNFSMVAPFNLFLLL